MIVSLFNLELDLWARLSVLWRNKLLFCFVVLSLLSGVCVLLGGSGFIGLLYTVNAPVADLIERFFHWLVTSPVAHALFFIEALCLFYAILLTIVWKLIVFFVRCRRENGEEDDDFED